MKEKPKFSIIVPHYDGVISDEVFLEGMKSLSESTYKDFEVLIYHDGPASRPLPDVDQFDFKYTFKETKTRYNDWGHSLRDLGIREASGEYIVHFNPDNILYPEALQGVVDALQFARSAEMAKQCNELQKTKNVFDNCYEVVVCPIIMEGVVRYANGSLARTRNPLHRTILDGYPVQIFNVDCMQVVASKRAWLSIGGWHNKTETSDGVLLQLLYMKYKSIFSQEIIGVHR